MDANKIGLLEFLGSGKKTFNIPVYQRNYDWKVDECKRLFQDIEKIALNNFSTDHFLGTVVYVTSKQQPNYTEYVLIDGQQRITSIMLLLKALYDAIQNEELKEDILESYLINKRAPEKLRIKLKPIESDMQAYENVLNDGVDLYNEAEKNNNNICNNYILFKELVANSKVAPDQLYNALNNIELVYIQLEKDKKSENPQMIFESLNSTGRKLTAADLIRNFLLMNHAYEEQIELYKNYWLKIEDLLSNSKISDFVRDYLTMKTCKITVKENVYEAFKSFANAYGNEYKEASLLKDLLKYAKYYSKFLYFNSTNEEINYTLKQFQQLKTTTVYPVLLFIFDDCFNNKKLDENELIDTMNTLISYIYRRLICGYPTNALNKVFANLIDEIKASQESKYVDKILRSLVQKTSTATFPKNKEFEIEFVQKDLYKSKIDKYTLYMIENYLEKEKIEDSDKITIEHIMPQKLTPQWQISLGKRYEEIHTQYLHTIGNLTITGYNSELSNKNFIEKKEIYKNSNISICRSVCKYNIWNDDSIKDRAKDLFQKAVNIWGLPEKYNTLKTNSGLDYTTPYNIQSNINCTGEKPKQLIILDNEYVVSTWKELLKTVCRELYYLDNTIFYNLIRHKDFLGRDRWIISDTAEGLRSPYRIAEALFIETNLSALDILNYCKIICNHYHVSDDVFFMLNKTK